MPKIFRIDLAVVASAYIRAESPEQAMEIARTLKGSGPEIEPGEGAIPISGLPFDNPNLPDVSLSPVMEIVGPTETAPPEEVG